MPNHFEYPVPPTYELREDFVVPYRFSEELQAYTIYMFQHPTKFKFREIFIRLMKPTDANDMLKSAYLVIKEYQANPQRYGHSLNNVVPTMVVRMWKTFLGIHKQMRNEVFTKYYPADMKTLLLAESKFLDIFLSDIETGNYIGHNDEMVKIRDGVGLREQRKPNPIRKYKYNEYLCGLE